MSKTAMIQARIEPHLKAEVEGILRELGLSVTEAISLYFNRIRMEHGIPFEVKIPNTETLRAMRDVESGRVEKHSDVDEMFKDLMKDAEDS